MMNLDRAIRSGNYTSELVYDHRGLIFFDFNLYVEIFKGIILKNRKVV